VLLRRRPVVPATDRGMEEGPVACLEELSVPVVLVQRFMCVYVCVYVCVCVCARVFGTSYRLCVKNVLCACAFRP